LIVGLAARLDAVNLSRLRVTATASYGLADLQDLDLAKVRGFCRDEDGCEVTLRFEIHPESGPAVLIGERARLFLAPDNLRWASIAGNGTKTYARDSDGTNDFVIEVAEIGTPSATCALMDGTISGEDSAEGFSLYASTDDPGSTAKCVVTL